ncbi:phage FluMu gp28-like protein [Defluviimonas denitrificans]|jgi:phage FluMu gp28-like protein|uniref:Phage FluMu gp28-like protein n=1 Tax=Albidovulum denitrificans TaxID=404881 RepID=A0A2S8S6G4_9RHOB|nr:terminase family protein [Defluviimonas denitrificans]PQV56397.1 phage FluMu gp28-like protein [Defluviimonas denitrificans]
MSALAPDSPIINFLPYQRAWIADQSRFKIGMFTRRGGKTFGSCGEIVADCTQAEIDGRKTRWTILSRSENTAKEAMEDALKPMTRAYYEVLRGLSRGGQPVFEEGQFHVPAHSREVTQGDRVYMVDVPEASYKTHEVRFPGGSRVTALSASPDAARGFGGNLLLDEFAFHADSRRIWGSAFPVAARGGHKIRVISTPNGKGNMFFQLMTAEGSNWSRHHVDIYEAVKQGLDVDIEELRKGIADEDAWAQEFELQWLDAASAWLDYDLISACEHAAAGMKEHYQGGPCFVGVDIAARNDLFVIVVLEAVGDVLWVREIIAKRRISFQEQDRLLDEVFRRYRVVRCRMDQTGMGEKPVEDAKRRHGQVRVEGVLFTSPARLELATDLKESMQDRKTRIPAGDPVLRADLHAIRSQVGVTGIRRLIADSDTDGHADRFWAMALAVSAGTSPAQDYEYRGLNSSGQGDGPDDGSEDRGWWRSPAGAAIRGSI